METDTLRNRVYATWRRLVGYGWQELLKPFGLELPTEAGEDNTARFKDALLKPLEYGGRRDVPGFEDAHPEAQRGIEPGDPARSIFYHALASPNVLIDDSSEDAYPSLKELEAVENWIYALQGYSLTDVHNDACKMAGPQAILAVVVFAQEYRLVAETPHKRHADMVYSRTGVSRVGDSPAAYLPVVRGFGPRAGGIPVSPVRYGAFLATRIGGSKALLGETRYVQSDDDLRGFWVPLHRLFSGPECLTDITELTIHLTSAHLSDKLRRAYRGIQTIGGTSVWDSSTLDLPPFRDTEIADMHSGGDGEGPWLVIPKLHDTLVEPASLNGSPVALHLPADHEGDFKKRISDAALNLFPDGPVSRRSTFALPRLGPAQVHIRRRVLPPSGGQQPKDEDITTLPNLIDVLNSGGYDARLFSDFTGDGYVTCKSEKLRQEKLIRPDPIPAYSIVAPPDFLPATSQRALADFAESLNEPLKGRIWGSTAPHALADQRFPPNLGLRFPASIPPTTTVPVFGEEDVTATAVITALRSCDSSPPVGRSTPSSTLRYSYLPDAAAGVLAPGWDVALARSSSGAEFLAAYGLASPWPEDARICAAMSMFWPAAGPDTARVFPPASATVAPLTDEEIDKETGWDGIAPPRLLPLQGKEARFVSYPSPNYTDYVRQAIAGCLRQTPLLDITPAEMGLRILAMARVYQALGVPLKDKDVDTGQLATAKAAWAVLSFLRGTYSDNCLQQAREAAMCVAESDAEKQVITAFGKVPTSLCFFHVYKPGGKPQADPQHIDRLLVEYGEVHYFFVDGEQVLMADDKDGKPTGWKLKTIPI